MPGQILRSKCAATAFILALSAMAFSVPVLPSFADSGQSKPHRIASINLCTDQLLMMLVPRERIVALSYLAAHPKLSVMAKRAQGLRLTRGNVEHIVLLRPDLVLVGTYTSPVKVQMLRKLGMRVVAVAPAANFDDIAKNIEQIGHAVGEEKKAQKLVADMRADLAGLSILERQDQPVAALFYANGYSSGKGTLIDAILTRAGYSSVARKAGVVGTRKLSLETFLTGNADALIFGRQSYSGDALAYEIFRHPAVRHMKRTMPSMSLSDALTICGTPYSAQAAANLSKFRLRDRAFLSVQR